MQLRAVLVVALSTTIYGAVDSSLPSGWSGPTSLIWSDNECPLIGAVNKTTAEDCISACITTSGCTAVNFNTDSSSQGSRCQLRGCVSTKRPVPTWSVPYWVGYADFPLPPSPPPPPSATLVKVELQSAVADGAVCLDGSAPAYYFRPGTGNGTRSYILFLEGGGWCAGLGDPVGGFDSCLSRSTTGLGSSKGYPPTMESGEAGTLFSTDATVNPKFYNWNVAYAK